MISEHMTSILEAFMVYIFWGGTIAILAADALVAFFNDKPNREDTFSGKAASVGRWMPSIPYFAGILPTHFWFGSAIDIPSWISAIVIFGIGGALTWWAWRVKDHPIHPISTFVLGLLVGRYFFPL